MIETAPSVTMRGNGVDRVAVGFDQFVALTQIVAQPADDAAALAGAFLEAADKLWAAWDDLTDPEEPERWWSKMAGVADDYRRARAALRGNGAVEG